MKIRIRKLEVEGPSTLVREDLAGKKRPGNSGFRCKACDKKHATAAGARLCEQAHKNENENEGGADHAS